MKKIFALAALFALPLTTLAQGYFLDRYAPYQPEIQSPESYLGYGIGEQHTRHDMIVGYLNSLAQASDRAQLVEYGRTYEGRKLVLLAVSSTENLARLSEIQQQHLKSIRPELGQETDPELPLIINLAYNVHGN